MRSKLNFAMLAAAVIGLGALPYGSARALRERRGTSQSPEQREDLLLAAQAKRDRKAAQNLAGAEAARRAQDGKAGRPAAQQEFRNFSPPQLHPYQQEMFNRVTAP